MVAVVAALAPRAALGQAHHPEARTWAAGAPASADVVFVVRDAALLRKTPTGRAIHDLLSSAGLLGETRVSWDALATALGWTRDQAFDQLLGGQLMIVVSGVPGTPGAHEPVRWALLARVTEATDGRLIEKLAAAPRGAVAGHQLLSVEHGKYELAVHRPRAGAQGERVFVLGPRGRPELFDRLLRALADTPEPGEIPISATAAAASLDQLGEGNAIILVRVEPSHAGEGKAAIDPWAAHAALALKTDDAGVSLRCVVSDPTAAELLDIGAGGPAIDLDAAFAGALVVMAEHPATKASLEPGSPLATVLAAVRMPEPLQRALASGQMIVVQPSPAPPGVAAGVAIRLHDPLGAAPAADAFMAGIVRLIEGEHRPEGAAPGMDFAGVAPRAVRTLPVAAWSAFPEFDWPELWVSWAFAPADDAGGGQKHADPINPAAPEPGWWVMAASGGKPDESGAGPGLAVDIIAQLRAAAPTNEPGRVLSQAVIRPAALARAVWPTVPDLGNWREVLGRVALVRWRFDAAGGGRITGTLRVDLTPAADDTPGNTLMR